MRQTTTRAPPRPVRPRRPLWCYPIRTKNSKCGFLKLRIPLGRKNNEIFTFVAKERCQLGNSRAGRSRAPFLNVTRRRTHKNEPNVIIISRKGNGGKNSTAESNSPSVRARKIRLLFRARPAEQLEPWKEAARRKKKPAVGNKSQREEEGREAGKTMEETRRLVVDPHHVGVF